MSRQILDMSNDKLEELFNKTNDNFEEVYQDNSSQESILATKAKQTDLDTLKARVDNLTANPGESTEGNAELIDIRVGADGKTYPTAGEAVRGQYNKSVKIANSIITSSDQLTSLADAEPNRIYLIGISKPDTLPDFPDPSDPYGVLVTFNHISTDNDGTIQLFACGSTKLIYARNAFNSTYGDWYRISLPMGMVEDIIKSYGSFTNLSDRLDDYLFQTYKFITATPDSPYDDADTYPLSSIVSGYIGLSSNTEGVSYGIIITYGFKNLGYAGVQMMYSSNGLVYSRVNCGNKWGAWKRLAMLSDIPATKVIKSSISMFEDIGVIGDSYSSGGIVIDGEIVVNYAISWPQVLRRKTGVDFVNYSFAGATCKTWLTNSDYGLAKLVSDSDRNLYIIEMGINDADRQETQPTGTIDDIKDDYTQNPDTFFGNLGRIISQVQQKAPNAKLIIATIPKTASQYVAYNNHLIQIANKFGIPYITTLSDPYLSSSDYQNSMSGGHPLAVSYSGMAVSMQNLIEDCLVTNKSYFSDYTGL